MSKVLVLGNIFKLSGFIDGIVYEFRVIVENMVGKSKLSKLFEFVFVLDFIDLFGKLVFLNIIRYIVIFKWVKFEYIGGFKIISYIVEKRDFFNGRWLKVNFSNILENEFIVSGLIEDVVYEFRVIVKNVVGVISLLFELLDVIICRDDIEVLRIMVDVKFKDIVILKVGEVFKLEVDVLGRLFLIMIWIKDGKEFEGIVKLEIKIVDFFINLVNKDLLRRDGGVYIFIAINFGGFVKYIFNVKVFDRLGLFEGFLVVFEVTLEKCVLLWLFLLDDGGVKIEYYVV